MKLVKAHYEILNPNINDPKVVKNIYKQIEQAGRTCYKSEDKITDVSAEKFVRAIAKSNHEAMLEHASMTVRFVVDRGVSHEIVRHRLSSFAQESQRYCNYSNDKFGKEVCFIIPFWLEKELQTDYHTMEYDAIWQHLVFDKKIDSKIQEKIDVMSDSERQAIEWKLGCEVAESVYLSMLESGATPQEARTVLPNSTKTEIIMTANMREWRHFFRLRALGQTGAPHPQMLEIAKPLYEECKEKLPALFGDLERVDD